MLGCHEFCGYYDWTFGYIQRHYGREALEDFWAKAIGRDAQRHYEQAGRKDGLRGLERTWNQTGVEEHCDWTFTLDEARNVLRWDMRRCPSRGYLLEHDLCACEDYCDHCMGWIIPLLADVGVEVINHEHNHLGQCWGEMARSDSPHESLDLEIDIRRDPSWKHGYLHRWQNNQRLPLIGEVNASNDPCDVLLRWFGASEPLLVLASLAETPAYDRSAVSAGALLVTSDVYAAGDWAASKPKGVLFGECPEDLASVAKRFDATPPEHRPLLMHTYLPGARAVDFVSAGLPRPLPILPQLIRRGYYAHQPHQPTPTVGVFLTLLAISMAKKVHVLGVALGQPASSKDQVNKATIATDAEQGTKHSLECDLEHLRNAKDRATLPVVLPEHLKHLLDDA
jgi:hypothetical protein